MTKQEALKKIEELKNFIKQKDNEEWITIDYSVVPQELFEKYSIKPFQIMKRKMRDKEGKVWNNINYFDAQKECEELSHRLLNIREMLFLLEFYKRKNKRVSCDDKEFLGIKELSYEEDVCYEWIYNLKSCAFLRGGYWFSGVDAGAFTLSLNDSPTYSSCYIGFRCAR